MRKAEKAAIVLRELEKEYPEPGCPLNHTDAFTLLVAVMLSAQCTDARVNKVTPALFAAASTPQAMVELGWERVREFIATCGLTETKAKRITQTSAMLIERHNGQVPCTFEELESLPGVGHKTASVVMTQAFGMPAFPVDTHIFRLARRWGLSKGKTVEKVETDLKKLFPKSAWNKLHVQLVLWGREHCPARGCRPTCPICALLGTV